MRFRQRPRDLPSINLTPLIDILFLVLMFLVLTAAFRGTFALDLALPAAETATQTALEAPDVVRIVVSATGEVSMDGAPVTLDELEARLVGVPDRDRVSVVLSADARSPHGDVIEVMDRVRRARIFNLRIEATPSSARTP